jgi:hypothetical protein
VWVKEMMEQLGMERDGEQEEAVTINGPEVMEFKTAPGLSFTKPLSASVNGKQVRSPRWSGILSTMISQLRTKGLIGEKLARELGIPTRVGKYEEEGSSTCPTLASRSRASRRADAWKEIERIANKWHIPVEIEFWWDRTKRRSTPAARVSSAPATPGIQGSDWGGSKLPQFSSDQSRHSNPNLTLTIDRWHIRLVQRVDSGSL